MKNSNENIYRTEAITAAQKNWLGTTRLERSLPVRLVIIMLFISMIIILLFLLFASYTRRVRLEGTVKPSTGIISVHALQSGRITKMFAKEGKHVFRGETLYIISSDSVTTYGETQVIVVEQLRIQRNGLEKKLTHEDNLFLLTQDASKKKRENLYQELEQIKMQILILEEAVDTIDKNIDKYNILLKKGIATHKDLEDRMQLYTQTRSKFEQLKREQILTQRKIIEINANLASSSLNLKLKTVSLRNEIIEIDKIIAEREVSREIKIIAPQTGTITGILVREGQMAMIGKPLLSILPTSGVLEIQLLAPSNAVGFIYEGARVFLRYDAFPYQKFGQYPGTITQVSRVAVPLADLGINSNGIDQSSIPGFYLVTVRPDRQSIVAYNSSRELRPGMSVVADVFLDTRTLFQWLSAPLFDLAHIAYEPNDEAAK